MEPLVDELTCVVCQDIYKDPRAFPCMHTFCSACINNIRASIKGNRNLLCPLCNFEVSQTYELPKNIALNNIVNLWVSKGSTQDTLTKIDDDLFSKASAPPLEETTVEESKILYPSRPRDLSSVSNKNGNQEQKTVHEVRVAPYPQNVAPPQQNVVHPSVNTRLNSGNNPNPLPNICLFKTVYKPFIITQSSVKSYFEEWKKSLYFAPKDFSSYHTTISTKKVLIPMWIFVSRVKSTFEIRNGIRTQLYTHTESSYRTLVPGFNSKEEYAKILVNLEWDGSFYKERGLVSLFHSLWKKDDGEEETSLTEQYSHRPEYPLLNYVPASELWTNKVEAIVKNEERNSFMITRQSSTKESIALRNMELKSVSARLLFLPCFMGTYNFDSSKYLFVVDGSTGKVKGTRPTTTIGKLFKINVS